MPSRHRCIDGFSAPGHDARARFVRRCPPSPPDGDDLSAAEEWEALLHADFALFPELSVRDPLTASA
jgi:hypothetical protein